MSGLKTKWVARNDLGTEKYNRPLNYLVLFIDEFNKDFYWHML